jgi:hypothetical protein
MSASRPAHNQHAACVRRDMHDECVATCTQVRKSVQNHFLAGGGVINLLSFGTSAISKSELGEGDSSRCDSGRPVARHSAAEALLVCFFLSLWRLRRSCWPFRRLSAANMALWRGLCRAGCRPGWRYDQPGCAPDSQSWWRLLS